MANYNKSFIKEKILVSGTNGFTGRFVCEELIKKEILAFRLFLGEDQIINGLKKKIFLFFMLILIIVGN